ncbi:MAG: rane-bound lytic murein transglycosylase [Hyphomicrobiales bacterium]|nr:rane-bound lytic murein transglycosylase [Hyphomicrobiales bacterium]
MRAVRLVICALLPLALPGTVLAQDDRYPQLLPAITGSVAPQSDKWSGEPGASGHPLMMPDAILGAVADFKNCLERIWPEAARRGITRASFDRFTADLEPDIKIMDFVDAQPEFTKAFWDYVDLLVTDERIAKGRELLVAHAATFDAVERAYGVDRHIIVAIWGVETKYGAVAGDRPVVRSTATLACVGRRQAYFKDEFLAALEILHRGDIRPEQLKGSWAGAFGSTQFMPTAFKRYAIDFDNDGRRDVVGSVPDVVASTANHLVKAGWVAGQTWGYEVVLPQGFNYMLADPARKLTLLEWARHGIARPGGGAFPRAGDKATLFIPAGARGPSFLMLDNFRAIMKYNPAEAYALAIGHLADRLRGGAPIVQAWPREERVLSRAERLELQQHLVRHGFDVGEPSGRLGLKTRAAVRDFQAREGLTPDGFATAGVLERLRR